VTAVRFVPATVVVPLAAVTLAGCSSGHDSASRRVVVTATGQVGPLRLDESDRADVIRFAGRPDAERRGRYVSFHPFDALGYGCRGKPATDEAGTPRCRSVFYLDSPSGKLELFITRDDRYTDVHGIRVGTPTATAERLLHRRVFVGCEADLFFKTRAAYLVLGFEGRLTLPSRRLVGGQVGFLVVHSRRRSPGVLDCIDS
jgi:hypothetical protein